MPVNRIYILPNRDGFTLIELMAVLVIMTAVSVVTLGGLSGANDQTELLRASGGLQRLDQLARAHSRSGKGAMTIVYSAEEHLVLLLSEIEEPAKEFELAPGLDVQLKFKNDESTDSIRVDRSGRSVDYSVSLRLANHSKSWSVCGLTGHIQQLSTNDD